MKKHSLKLFIILILLSKSITAQNYNLNPYNLNVTGMPGDFLLSGLTVTNPNPVDINIFINRIEKNIPNGWTSCFCYPTCLAPWLDTLTWTIPAGSSVDIEPNFQTTLVPGFGTVRVELLNLTSGGAPDTITFTGSTMSTGIMEIKEEVQIFPNPVKDKLFIETSINFPITVTIYDSSGKLVYYSTGNSKEISFAEYSDGIYSIRVLIDENVIERKVTVLKY